ncbi:MAG TPA: MarR family transcriptional regulator [Verrucomicrobiae bacterium]|jgi:DNA-binding MarR family transcriptional regulator|nr:MarR family transcriptional regulator [Verrucomicrobiae bacterium]
MPETLQNFTATFRSIQPKFSRMFTRILNRAGLTLPQYALLTELGHATRAMTMTEISRKLYITKPAVTSLVDRLEKGGYLRRAAHPDDRRIFLLEILAKGRKTVDCVQGIFLNMLLATLKNFSASDRKIIEKFYAHFSITIDDTLCSKECRS